MELATFCNTIFTAALSVNVMAPDCRTGTCQDSHFMIVLLSLVRERSNDLPTPPPPVTVPGGEGGRRELPTHRPELAASFPISGNCPAISWPIVAVETKTSPTRGRGRPRQVHSGLQDLRDRLNGPTPERHRRHFILYVFCFA